MIGRVSGRLLSKNPPQVLLEASGVGYEIDVPMSTFYSLPATGEAVTLHTHLVVREDAHILYGFATLEERAAFRRLIRISGVGARTALSVLSGLSVSELAQAVTLQDTARLTKVPGIGKKTAERLLLEKGVEIDTIRVDLEPQRRVEMVARTRRRTVPQIYIGDHHVGGCDELYALEREGKLDALLASGAQ